jgi:murein DD-endopeptidase MepM/ murein hydrolase activator NlpD
VFPVAETAKTKRQREIEQTLLELTHKARSEKQQQAQQQAEIDAAKYAEAGDIKAAKQAASHPALPPQIRAKLLKGIAARQVAQKAGKTVAQASKTGTLTVGLSPGGETGRVAGSGYGVSGYSLSAAPNYATQAILPTGPITSQFPFAKLLGRVSMGMVFPLTIAAPVTSGFGWRVHPISGSPRFHQGLDLGAPFGSPVVAAKAGVVEAADFLGGYGLTVVLRYQDSYQTLYAHLSQIFVKPGDVIKPGQLIGQVGSTGNSTGPHLHFEFHHLTAQGWMALDPAAILNQAIAQAQKQTLPSLAVLGEGQLLVNLSASGLLDMNEAGQQLADLRPGQVFLADLLFPSMPIQPSSGINFSAPEFFAKTSGHQAEMLIPFTILPTAVPELDWLISPFMDSLMASQMPLFPLPGLPAGPQTTSFQPISDLAQLPEPVVFNPVLPSALNLSQGSSEPRAKMQLANVKLANMKLADVPLADGKLVTVAFTREQAGSGKASQNLSIAATVPGAVNLEILQSKTPKKLASNGHNNGQPRSQVIQPGADLKTVRLTDQRLKTLKLSTRTTSDLPNQRPAAIAKANQF